jgi:hypothetical protein
MSTRYSLAMRTATSRTDARAVNSMRRSIEDVVDEPSGRR